MKDFREYDKLMKSTMEYNLPDSASIIDPIIMTGDSHGIIRVFRFDMSEGIREGILAQLKEQENIIRNTFNNENSNDSSNSFDILDQSVFSSNRTMTRSTDSESKKLNIIPSNETSDISDGKISNEVREGSTQVKKVSYIGNISTDRNDTSNIKIGKNSSGFFPRRSNVSSLFTKLSVGPELKSTIDSNHSNTKKDKISIFNDINSKVVFPKISEEWSNNNVIMSGIYSASSSRNSIGKSLSALNLLCSTCNSTRFEPTRQNSLSQRDVG